MKCEHPETVVHEQKRAAPIAKPLDGNQFLFALNEALAAASPDALEAAFHGAASWSTFFFKALEAAARDEMVSCAARHSTTSGEIGAWTKREYLFDATWFRRNCRDWDTPDLILEHENLWDLREFMVDFWKLLLGYAPLRVMVGYSRDQAEHEAWISAVNDALRDCAIRIPADVEDLILLGHRGMKPTDYSVYRRRDRQFELELVSLEAVRTKASVPQKRRRATPG